MLDSLVPEILDQILNYCPVVDLKKLSATNSKYNLLLQRRLYHTVKIPEKSKNARRVRKHLHLLNYTKVLFMGGYDYSLPYTIVEAISTLAGLQSLNFTQSRVDNAALEVICGGVHLLEVLTLSRSKVTSEGCEYISKLEMLEELYVDGCDVEDDGIQHLARLTKLRVLDVSCRYVTGGTFGKAANLRSLRELYLLNSNISDIALQHISKFTNLKKLDVSKCYLITNAGISFISALPILTELNISYCMSLNNECLSHILDMTALRTLDIRGMDDIDNIEQLLRPNVDVNWDFHCMDHPEPMYFFHPLYNNINALWDYDVGGDMGYLPGLWYQDLDEEEDKRMQSNDALDDEITPPSEEFAVEKEGIVFRERSEHERRKSWLKKEKLRPLIGNVRRRGGNIDQRNNNSQGYQRR